MVFWSFIYLICLYHSTVSYHHHCIHDKLKKHKLLISNVNYESTFEESIMNKGRRLGMQVNEYESIRILPYWNSLTSKQLCENQIIAIKNIVSAAISYFESFIKVKRAKGPLKYARYCISGKTVNGPISDYLNCYEYDEATQCGHAQIPLSHFRQDWKYYRDGSVNTNLYPSGAGLANVDLVLYVTANSTWCTDGTLAWTFPCVQDQRGRPIFGTINFCPSESIGAEWKYDMITTIHELTHVLGFSNTLYSDFIDPKTGEKLGYSNVISADTHIMNGYMTNKWVITPTVQAMSQFYYNCTDIIGVPLENNDLNSISSHWEEHFLNSEYMMQFSDEKNAYVSILTLALLQDTGWYDIDFNYADAQFKWGSNEGCTFFEKECFNVSDRTDGISNFGEYFCNPNRLNHSTICTTDHMSLGFCAQSLDMPKLNRYKYFGNNGFYGYYTSEYCPYVDSYSYNNSASSFDYECFDLNGNSLDSISSKYVAWSYSISSRCINLIEMENDDNNTFKSSAFCFPIICNGYDKTLQRWNNIDIVIGNLTVNCLSKDVLKMKHIVSGGYKYLVQCPDIDPICINEKPFTCQRGVWSDQLNKCICKAGYTGDFCDEELINIIDSVQEYNGSKVDIAYEYDLCALIIDNNNLSNDGTVFKLTGTWKYMGGDSSNKSVYPYYAKQINNVSYYLYFDAWYHIWNIGTQLNDKYVQFTVEAICDTSERPYNVIDCSHVFYFADDTHYLWTQNIYFILLHGDCENASIDLDDFNASDWSVHTFYMNTASPVITSTMINETNKTSTDDNCEWEKKLTKIIVIVTIIVTVCVILICIGVYGYYKMGNKKLTKQLTDIVKQDLVDENDAEANMSEQMTTLDQ